jgi:glycosyltransferase involved in cell wall biosynthesis
MRAQAPELKISVVLETDSSSEACHLGLREALRGLAGQTYPRELTELVVVDSGQLPELERLLRQDFPGARVVNGAGMTKYEMKNLGAQATTGPIVAYTDGDCVLAPTWIAEIASTLGSAPAGVVGVQGRTVLEPARFSRQVTVLLYGMHTDRSGRWARRIISDNCAFRREFILGNPFAPAALSTTPDSVMLAGIRSQGFEMLFNDRMRALHDNPATLHFFMLRAYGNGFCMMRARAQTRSLRAGWLGRLGPLGPPLLVAGKVVADLPLIAANGPTLGLAWYQWIAFLPLYVSYYAGHLAGGFASVLRLRMPHF